jgi:hypothetical protein
LANIFRIGRVQLGQYLPVLAELVKAHLQGGCHGHQHSETDKHRNDVMTHVHRCFNYFITETYTSIKDFV